MTVTVTARGPLTVRAAVAGEIDICTSGQFQESLTEAVTDHAPRSTVVDLSAVSFLDASGVTALLRLFEHADRCGVDISLTRVPSPVHLVLKALDLTGRFGIPEHG